MNYKAWLKAQGVDTSQGAASQASCLYDYKDKQGNCDLLVSYMLDRTQAMFEYDGLPDTIPARVLELYLQMNGNVCIANVTDEDIAALPESKRERARAGLYPFTGGMGGELDAYYMPTIYTVANPYLAIMRNYKIDIDCVVIPNDALYMGLLPMFGKYARGMVENELSMHLATVNARVSALLSASDDATKKSAEKYLQDIEQGEQGVIASSAFLEGIKSQPYAGTGTTGTIQNLIELEQYLKASWFNSLGLNANYNMKRESINAGESQLNDDALLPLVDDMLNQREIGLEKVNAMYGTSISVRLASSWEDNLEEIALEHEALADDGDDEGEGGGEDPEGFDEGDGDEEGAQDDD